MTRVPPSLVASDRVTGAKTWVSDDVVRVVALEVEAHVAGSGWDQPPRLYALVPTSELAVAEPALAVHLGIDEQTSAGTLTPIEQEELPTDRPLEQVLHEIGWSAQVVGCAAVLERVVLPSAVEAELPADAAELNRVVDEHPAREEVRVAAAVIRDGRGHCAVRMRAHDRDDAVLDGPTLVPGLLVLLAQTLED